MKKSLPVVLVLALLIGWWALRKPVSPKVSRVEVTQTAPETVKQAPVGTVTHARKPAVARAPELKEKFDLVDSLARDGRRADVLELLRSILTQAPDNVEALYLMGYYLGEDPATKDQAVSMLTKVLDKDPSHDAAMGELILLSGGTPSKEVVDSVRSAYERNPGSTNLAAGLGKILVDRGDDASAIPLLEKAAQDPEFAASSLNTLIEVYRDGGDLAKTIETYDRVISLQEDHLRSANAEDAPMFQRDVTSARLGKVDVLIRSGDFDGAERVLRQIRTAEPENPDVAILQQQLDRARG